MVGGARVRGQGFAFALGLGSEVAFALYRLL